MKDKLSAHQETISILSQQKEPQIKLYKTHEDKKLDKVIALENKVKVLDNIVYKTSQSVQTMNMLNVERVLQNLSSSRKLKEQILFYVTNLQCDYLELLDKCECLETELSKSKMIKAEFEKSLVIRQLNAFKSQRPSVLGKPTTFSNSFDRKDFSKSKSITQNNVSTDFSKPVTTQTLPPNKNSILKNTNMLAPRMYKLHTDHNQARTSQLPQDSRKTNKRVSFSTRVILTTSVSRPQLKSNPMGDRVMRNNRQGKTHDVEDQRRSVKLAKNKMFVTACNDSLNAKTLNVNSVCATCDTCVLNDKHDMCVLNSVAKPIKKTVASKSNKKPRNFTRKLYEHHNQARTSQLPQDSRKTNKRVSFSTRVILTTSVSRPQLKSNPMGDRVMRNNSQGKTRDVEDQRRSVKLAKNKMFVTACNDSLNAKTLNVNSVCATCDTYLVQGAVTIKWVYYVKGLNHNLFSVGQFSDADLEVAFKKSTCYICDLKGNDLLTGKAKQKSFHTKLTPSSKRRLQLLHMDLCSPMRVASINGKRYVLVIVDDYSRYSWTHFLRSKDKTPEVLINFLRLVQRGLQAQVRVVRTDKGTKFLNQTLDAYFATEGIHHQTSVARTPEQNGVVERQNRKLVEAARTMLSAAKVPLFFWAKAIATTCFTQNRSLVIPQHEKHLTTSSTTGNRMDCASIYKKSQETEQ
nr:putative ribonuclease H-like domain-containing protein [Tanacetum cinerariifolium]